MQTADLAGFAQVCLLSISVHTLDTVAELFAISQALVMANVLLAVWIISENEEAEQRTLLQQKDSLNAWTH